MLRFFRPLFVLCILFATPVQAANTTALLNAIAMAKKGAVVTVEAGDYDLADVKIRRDLSLIGEGDVVFFSSRPVAKGLLNPVDGASLRIENITFRDAASPDLNGAGIRHDGKDLMIVNCRFVGNENGVLATGDETGAIDIANSAFIGNGHGDGYSHGIYVLRARSLVIHDSLFEGTKIGHHVKSLAGETIIRGTDFDDADGRTSYAVDASRGGAVSIEWNSFLKAADADNNALFNYDLTRGGEAVELRIINNRIVNRHRNGLLLRNSTDLEPLIEGNNLVNEAGGRMASGEPAPGLIERARQALERARSPD